MIPIILGAIALGTTAFGGLACVAGMADMDLAKKIGERAQKRYKSKVSQLQADWETANQIAEEYSQLQIDIKMRTVGRFVDFIERRIGQQASQSDRQILEGLEISIQQLKQYQVMAIEAEEWVKGGLSAAATGAAVSSGTITIARSVGTVTVTRFFGLWATEVGISQLSGVAAWDATMTWLGSGSMAAGNLVLGGITLGSALSIIGFQLAGKGEEALTKAREYEAKVNTEIAKIEAARDFVQQVKRQIFELRHLVKLLNDRAVLGLNELESMPSFNKDRDACKFQQLGLLIKALTEIIKTPILDKKGLLNQDAVTVHAKYRYLGV
ncbi:hypothetical protein [Chroococcidiopsis sp. CCNUC1]|uniref:hypothetical protein n=1 Tax=Chroococcidiopsis sp. CCNUC1 TaxID=2653189 RepID=UPI002020B626|nr:hypothetical protein [Chroococcidiopsis sp. CCNUC1]URD50567.1 hypothetical protein M5J74_00920 [Chroococcidiopsis sp. CCNUC1]